MAETCLIVSTIQPLVVRYLEALHEHHVRDRAVRRGVACFRVQGSGFRVQGAGCGVEGSGFRVQGAGCRVQGSGLWVEG